MFPVFANSGIPMLMTLEPLMGLLLIPVILVEMVVAKRFLGLSFRQSKDAVMVANLVSTLVGFPLLWTVWFAFEVVMTKWNMPLPFDGVPAYILVFLILAPWTVCDGWLVWLTGIVLMIPAFFLSVFVEGRICRRYWRDLPRERVTAYSWRANGCSYLLLVLVWFVFFLFCD